MRCVISKIPFLILSFSALIFAGPSRADLITPTAATPSSQITAYGRQAVNAINGSGLSGPGNAGDTHSVGESGLVWTSNGNVIAPNDLNPYIIFDLGARYDVTLIREWGYNDPTVNSTTKRSATGFSPKLVDVYTSTDGTTFTFAGTVIFAQATGVNGYTGHEIAVNYPAIRYIKLDIMSNHDGAVFDGTGATAGPDGRSLTGLSEIRFEGSPTTGLGAATHPLPATGATAVEPNADLSWDANDPDRRVSGYQITIGVGALTNNYVVHTATVPRGASDRETYAPPANIIQTGGPYWWRVDKVLAAETITGSAWTFTTRSETSAEKNTRMAWFRNGKVFGAIVWGLYSGAEGVWPPQTGTKNASWTYAEWMQYWKNLKTLNYRDTLEPYLTGENFDAAQMARMCKEAGMEMVYVMPRHHDGYAIWDTQTTTELAPNGFKITNSPYNPAQRDYLKELVDALHAEGLRVGFYFSLGDWHHPDFPHGGTLWAHPNAGVADPTGHTEVWANYITYLHQQVREVLDLDAGTDSPHYGLFDVVYFDYSSNGINGESWGATKLVHMVRQHNPNIIINNRLWNGLANTNGDFSTPEANVDNVDYGEYGDRDWEAIMSANDPPTWGYGRPDLYPFKTAAELVWDIVDVASKGGTIELSVSPKADGSLHPDQIAQYAGLGAWIATNSASVKGTSGNPTGIRPAWGEYTARRGENRLYLHVFDRPSDGKVVTSNLYGTVKSAWLLSNPTRTLAVTSAAEGSFAVDLPADAANTMDTVIVVDYEFPPALTTSTAVAGVSSENVLGMDRDANHTVDASGLTYGPGSTFRHADGETGKAWTTVGKLGPGTDYSPYIAFDLGDVMNITRIREWGYNSSFAITGGHKISLIGPDQVDVYTSLDGTAYTFAETVHFALAPGADGYTGHTIPVNYTGVRYIKLVIKTNHDGAVFDGTGTSGGTVDGRSLTGLSEIRFEGVPSPSPHFSDWLDSFGLTGADRDPNADSDGDGSPNLIEFATHGNPRNPEPARATQGRLDAGYFTVTFERPDNASGVTLAFQTSTDLQTWPDSFMIGPTTGESSPEVTITPNGASPDTVTLTLPLADHPIRFIRLVGKLNP